MRAFVVRATEDVWPVHGVFDSFRADLHGADIASTRRAQTADFLPRGGSLSPPVRPITA